MPEETVFAKESRLIEFGGVGYHIQLGAAWAADDPLVAAHPDLFGPPANVNRTSRPVETATRAPGERRGPGKSRR